jgi:hypothetical protein
MKITEGSVAIKNFTIDICGPVNGKTAHDGTTFVRAYLDKRNRYGRNSHQYRLALNKPLCREKYNAEIGSVTVTVKCPVCLLYLRQYGGPVKEPQPIYGVKYVSAFLDGELAEPVLTPAKEIVLVCSQKCADLFNCSPLSYEQNYV